MQTVLQDEDGRARENRAIRERQAAEAVIAERDASVVPSEAERIALRQIENQNRRMPLDHAAIMKFRAIEPGLFTLLPSDDMCLVALGGVDMAAVAGEKPVFTTRLKK